MQRKLTALLLLALALTLCACGGEASTQATQATQAKLDLAEIYTGMAESLPQMIQMDEATLRDYCGVPPENYTQAVAAVNYNGLETDEIWLIEATDEAAADSIQEMAELRLKMKGEETESYAPEQYKVVQKAKLIREGLYIALIVTPESEALAQQFQDALNGK